MSVRPTWASLQVWRLWGPAIRVCIQGEVRQTLWKVWTPRTSDAILGVGMIGVEEKKFCARGGRVVEAPFPGPPPLPFRAHVTGTPDGLMGEVGRGGGGGFLRYPNIYGST